MSIEPISTGMSYQAANTPQARPVEQVATESSEKNMINEQQVAAEPRYRRLREPPKMELTADRADSPESSRGRIQSFRMKGSRRL